jgi:pyruvate dehydrogenase E1 component beta subunit
MTIVRREIRMPSVTPAMTAGRVARWHVAEGQSVAAGDLLVEVATPTATLEIEAENEGRIERILVPAGTEGVEVDTPIAILLGVPGGAYHGVSSSPMLSFAGLQVAEREDASGAALTSKAQLRDLTYREALRDALSEEMCADPAVFVFGADVAQNRGALRVTQGLVDAFGRSRVVSVPAIDEALIGMAVGAAYAGLRPVVELASWGRTLEAIAPYLTSAAETFYLSGGRLPVPIVFRGPNGFSPGMTGEDSRCVAAFLAQIPGLKVVQPATPGTAKALLRAAIRDGGPVAVLEHEQLYALRGPIGDEAAGVLGVARIARAGADVTVAAAGHGVHVALEAATLLALGGIEAEVVDLMSIRPLDRATVTASVGRTGRLVTVEEGWGESGIGAELVASIVASPSFSILRSPPLRIAGAAVPMPYAAELQAAALPAAARIAAAVTALVDAK